MEAPVLFAPKILRIIFASKKWYDFASKKLLAKPQMVFVARETQKICEGFTKLASLVASLIMCLRSGSRIKSVAHLPPSPFSTPTSLGPRHFDSYSHLFLADFGSGNAELRTIQSKKKQVRFIPKYQIGITLVQLAIHPSVRPAQ